MKNRFIVVRKKIWVTALVLVLCSVVCFGVLMGVRQQQTFSSFSKFSVVIDAGHGGADPGVVGKSGLVEAEVNLCIAQKLQEILSSAGMRVVMTRMTTEGLYGQDLQNFKARDFRQRKQIIAETKPNMVISIHGNKFPSDANRRGIQVFYNREQEEGKRLAICLQEEVNVLNQKYSGKTYSCLSGDYFMVKCTEFPSVIVECGFLSNEEDERLLSSEAYQREIAEAVYRGIGEFIR